MTLPFLYQLQNASYLSLSSVHFRIGVFDPDDAALGASEVSGLQDQDKMLLAYLSIGEAEDYRAYWQVGDWDISPPDFLLDENPDWPGNYSVKFWDDDWQRIIFARVDEAIDRGYNGMYLDIVDAYEVAQVQNAYPGTSEELRQEMIDFVVAISEYAKGQKPGFLVVPQNAVGLLANNENDPSGPNTAYLNSIDGLGVEDLWYNGNNVSGWTAGDLSFIQYALDADKFVLATSYPTNDAKQATFITNAINAGLIPFVANRELTGIIDPADNTIDAAMAGNPNINVPWTTFVNPAPVINSNGGGATAAISIAENVTAVTTVAATDVNAGQSLTYLIGGGADAALFNINPTSGTLVFVSGPDFEMPQDAGANNIYDVIVKVSDNGTPLASDTQALAITVTNVKGIAYNGRSAADVVNGTLEADTLNGAGGNDTLLGLGGNDTLNGGAGNDTLNGGAGNDRLTGGAGIDVLTGGLGADTFVFLTIAEIGNSTVAASRERVTDFLEGSDKFDFSSIDANTAVSGNQAFTLLAENAAITAAAQLRWFYDAANNETLIEGNINAALAPDFRLALTGHHTLAGANFIL